MKKDEEEGGENGGRRKQRRMRRRWRRRRGFQGDGQTSRSKMNRRERPAPKVVWGGGDAGGAGADDF